MIKWMSCIVIVHVVCLFRSFCLFLAVMYFNRVILAQNLNNIYSLLYIYYNTSSSCTTHRLFCVLLTAMHCHLESKLILLVCMISNERNNIYAIKSVSTNCCQKMVRLTCLSLLFLCLSCLNTFLSQNKPFARVIRVIR